MKDKRPDIFRTARRVYLIGNGGSFANAEHICNDLIDAGVKAYTLNAAFLTATGNDCGYEHTFARWINVVGEPGDLLIALSGSGKSPNIRAALGAAKDRGMTTVAIFGAYNQHDGFCVDILDASGDNMQEAEEHQIVWGHEVMRRLKDMRQKEAA